MSPWSRKARDRLERHRVDRVGTDQLLHVEHVAVLGILGAGAGPQAALHPRTCGAQVGELVAAEDALIRVVGQLGVRDRGLAAQRPAPPACRARSSSLSILRVDPADEEARHACTRPSRRRARAGGGGRRCRRGRRARRRSTLNISVTLTLMPSAIAPSMAGRPAAVAGILMNTFGRSRRAHRLARARQRRVAVLGQVRLDLDAGEAVGPVRPVVDRAQDVGGVADVGDRDLLVDLAGVVAGLDLAADSSSYWPVATALAKIVGLLVRPRMPSSTISRELAARDQVAVDEVDPRALALLGVQPLQRVHDLSVCRPRADRSCLALCPSPAPSDQRRARRVGDVLRRRCRPRPAARPGVAEPGIDRGRRASHRPGAGCARRPARRGPRRRGRPPASGPRR